MHPARPLSAHNPIIFASAVMAAILGNVALEYLSRILQIPLFLDTVFTALAAVGLGIAGAVVVGASTNITLELLTGPTMVFSPFVVTNVMTGVLVWLFVHYGLFHKPVHAVVATLITAGVNAALGAVLASVFVVGQGAPIRPVDHIVTGIILTGRTPLVAAFLARVPVNMVDKGISIFAAYFLYRYFIQRDPTNREQPDSSKGAAHD